MPFGPTREADNSRIPPKHIFFPCCTHAAAEDLFPHTALIYSFHFINYIFRGVSVVYFRQSICCSLFPGASRDLSMQQPKAGKKKPKKLRRSWLLQTGRTKIFLASRIYGHTNGTGMTAFSNRSPHYWLQLRESSNKKSTEEPIQLMVKYVHMVMTTGEIGSPDRELKSSQVHHLWGMVERGR